MAVDDSKKGKPQPSGTGKPSSWRGAGDGNADPGSEQLWRQGSLKDNRAVARKNFRRRVALAVFSIIVLVLVGVFVNHWLRSYRATPLLAITITQYQAPLPPNSFALEDALRTREAEVGAGESRELLVSFAAKDSASGGRSSAQSAPRDLSAKLPELRKNWIDLLQTTWNEPDPEQIVAPLRQWLKEAKPGGPGRRLGFGGTVIVYLSGHGVVDGQGNACILPANPRRSPSSESTHLDSRRWLPVKTIVEALEAETSKHVRKLLILDCNRIDALWPIGLLYNGFAEALRRQFQDSESVAILTSAGPGEMGWSSVELQGTPFGFYTARALNGHPDADDNHDERITLSELKDYVRRNVFRWVRANRDDTQTPLLVARSGVDFDVVHVNKTLGQNDDVKRALEPPADLKDAQNALAIGARQADELWDKHEEMLAAAEEELSPVWSEHCLAWHQFQQELIRYEALLLSGMAYESERNQSVDNLFGLARQLLVRGYQSLPAPSLPLARRWQRDWEAQREEVRALLEGKKKAPIDSYYTRVDGAWHWLADEQNAKPDRDKVNAALEFIRAVPRPVKNDVLEAHLMTLLVADAPDDAWDSARELLKMREAAEVAAAPGDVRPHYAIAPRVEAADQALRTLENALFINGEAWQKALADVGQQASYQEARQMGETLAGVFRQRDRAWAELPYIALWLARRPRSAASDNLQDDLARVSSNLRRLREFDERVESFLASVREESWSESAQQLAELSEAVSKIGSERQKWRTQLDQLEQDISSQSKQESKLRTLHSLLATPLITGSQRQAFFRDYLSIVTMPSRPPGTIEPGEPADDPAPDLVEHPALVLAALEPPARKDNDETPNWLRLAEQGDSLRRSLKELLEAARNPKAAGDGGNRREEYSSAERRFRPAAALCAASELSTADPIARLARYDLNQFAAWHARRVVADFWGSDAEEVGQEAKSYFAALSNELYNASKALGGDDGRPPWNAVRDDRQRRIEAIQAAAFGSEKKRPKSLGATFKQPVSLIWPAEMPEGTAALFALGPDGGPRPASLDGKEYQRLAVSIPAETEKTLTLKRGDDEPDAAALTVVRWYRGHRREANINPPSNKKITVVYQPKTPDRTTVTVKGSLQQASIVFILDCSKSMEELTGAEKTVKMEVARKALSNLVSLLPTTENCRLGLWLYGHRVNRNGNDPNYPVLRNRDWEPFAKDLKPRDDVELVMPSRPFDKSVQRRFIALLDARNANDQYKVRPFGFTPLYKSLVDAIGGLSSDRGSRHLVLITDGKDQPDANALTKPQTAAEKHKPVIEAMAADARRHPESPIQLHLLDCSPKGERFELQTLRDKIDGSLKGYDGYATDYIEVDKWGALEDKLIEALGLGKYEVQRLASTQKAPVEARLNQTAEVRDPFPPPKEYEIRVPGRSTPTKKVRLEGGEALQLRVETRSPKRRRLIFEAWEGSETGILVNASRHRSVNVSIDASTWPGDEGDRPQTLDVCAHTPSEKSGTWTFPISIQHAGQPRGFTMRPTDVWIEITPLSDSGERLFPYPFYDALIEMGTPVPVLLCQAPDWPRQAHQAEIEAWFGYSAADPVRMGIRQFLSDSDEPQFIEGLPRELNIGVALKQDQDGSHVTVVEFNDSGGKLGWLRVQTSRPPDQVVHNFGVNREFATHEFLFRGMTLQQLREEELWLTDSQKLKQSLIHVEPLRVDVR